MVNLGAGFPLQGVLQHEDGGVQCHGGDGGAGAGGIGGGGEGEGGGEERRGGW